MSANAEAAQGKALQALTEILEDKSTKPELRIEACKLIVNRPRFFIDPDVHEV